MLNFLWMFLSLSPAGALKTNSNRKSQIEITHQTYNGHPKTEITDGIREFNIGSQDLEDAILRFPNVLSELKLNLNHNAATLENIQAISGKTFDEQQKKISNSLALADNFMKTAHDMAVQAHDLQNQIQNAAKHERKAHFMTQDAEQQGRYGARSETLPFFPTTYPDLDDMYGDSGVKVNYGGLEQDKVVWGFGNVQVRNETQPPYANGQEGQSAKEFGYCLPIPKMDGTAMVCVTYLTHPFTPNCPVIGQYYERPILALKRCGRMPDCLGLNIDGDVSYAATVNWTSGEYIKHIKLISRTGCDGQATVHGDASAGVFLQKQHSSNLEEINKHAVYDSFVLIQGGGGCYSALANSGFLRAYWALNNFMDGISGTSGGTWNTLNWFQKESPAIEHDLSYEGSESYKSMYGDAVYDPWWNTFGPRGQFANYRFAQFCTFRMWLLRKADFDAQFGNYTAYLLSCLGCKGLTYHECNSMKRSLHNLRQSFGNVFTCVRPMKKTAEIVTPPVLAHLPGLTVPPYEDQAWFKTWEKIIYNGFMKPLNISENEDLLDRSARVAGMFWTYSRTKVYNQLPKDWPTNDLASVDLKKFYGHDTVYINSKDVYMYSQNRSTDTGDSVPHHLQQRGLLKTVASSSDATGVELMSILFTLCSGACKLNFAKLTQVLTKSKQSSFVDLMQQGKRKSFTKVVQDYFLGSLRNEKEETVLKLLRALHEESISIGKPFCDFAWAWAHRILGKDREGVTYADGGLIDGPPIAVVLSAFDQLPDFDKSKQLVMQLSQDDIEPVLKFFRSKQILLHQVNSGTLGIDLEQVTDCESPMNALTPNIFQMFDLLESSLADVGDVKYKHVGPFTEEEALHAVEQDLSDGFAALSVRVRSNSFFNINGGFEIKVLVSLLRMSHDDWMLLKYLPAEYQKELKKIGFPRVQGSKYMMGFDWVPAYLLSQTSAMRIYTHLCEVMFKNHLECSVEMELEGTVMPVLGKSHMWIAYH